VGGERGEGPCGCSGKEEDRLRGRRKINARGERRKMERLWSGVCWSVRGITVERGRKRWNQPGQQNEATGGAVCREDKIL